MGEEFQDIVDSDDTFDANMCQFWELSKIVPFTPAFGCGREKYFQVGESQNKSDE
jgi:hypothetical protein